MLTAQELQAGFATPGAADDPLHLGRGFVVQSQNYLSARWPGDAYSFAFAFSAMLTKWPSLAARAAQLAG